MESFINFFWQRTWDKFHLEYLKQLLYIKYFLTRYIVSNCILYPILLFQRIRTSVYHGSVPFSLAIGRPIVETTVRFRLWIRMRKVWEVKPQSQVVLSNARATVHNFYRVHTIICLHTLDCANKSHTVTYRLFRSTKTLLLGKLKNSNFKFAYFLRIWFYENHSPTLRNFYSF